MGFPLSVDGRVEVPLLEPASIPGLLASLELALHVVRATEVVSSGSEIAFRGEIARAHFGWRVLSSVDAGEIRAVFGRPGSVRFTFSLRYLLAVVTVVSIAFGVIMARGSFVRGMLLAVITWAVSFGGSYIVSAVRLPRWVERTVRAQSGVNPAG